MELDTQNIKILFELMQNAREHNSKIGKIVNLSSESVKKRIEKLEKKGIIKAYKTNINYKILGLLEYDIYLKLRNYSQKELKEIINIISISKYATWIGTCFGKFDIRISIVVKKPQNIEEFIKYLKINIKKYYVCYKILFLLEKYKINQEKIISNFFKIDTKKLNINRRGEITNILNNKNNKILILDSVEKKIIKILNNNPKIHLVEISKKMGITAEACKYRIKELKNKNIITSFSVIIDGNKLNKIWSVFLFKIENVSEKEFINFIKIENNISGFSYLLGDWNYSITVFADNVLEIHNILMNFRNRFPQIIKEYELILLFETFKYPAIAEIIFE